MKAWDVVRGLFGQLPAQRLAKSRQNFDNYLAASSQKREKEEQEKAERQKTVAREAAESAARIAAGASFISEVERRLSIDRSWMKELEAKPRKKWSSDELIEYLNHGQTTRCLEYHVKYWARIQSSRDRAFQYNDLAVVLSCRPDFDQSVAAARDSSVYHKLPADLKPLFERDVKAMMAEMTRKAEQLLKATVPVGTPYYTEVCEHLGIPVPPPPELPKPAPVVKPTPPSAPAAPPSAPAEPASVKFKPSFRGLNHFRLLPPAAAAVTPADIKAFLQAFVVSKEYNSSYCIFSLVARSQPAEVFLVLSCSQADSDFVCRMLVKTCPGLVIEPEAWSWLPDTATPLKTMVEPSCQKDATAATEFVLNRLYGSLRTLSSFSSDPFSVFLHNAEELAEGETVIFTVEFTPADPSDDTEKHPFYYINAPHAYEALTLKEAPQYAAEPMLYIVTGRPDRVEYLTKLHQTFLAQYGSSDATTLNSALEHWQRAEEKFFDEQKELRSQAITGFMPHVLALERYFHFLLSFLRGSGPCKLVPWEEQKSAILQALGCIWIYLHYKEIVRQADWPFTWDKPQHWLQPTPPPAEELEKLVNQECVKVLFCRYVILGADEMAGFFHFPHKSITNPLLLRADAMNAAKPPDELTTSDGLLLGTNEWRRQTQQIRLPHHLRSRHMYIVGASGSGKSNLLKNCIRQDIEAGRGCCVIDPHGDLVTDVLPFIPQSRLSDVVIFNPSDRDWPASLNPFIPTNDDNRNDIALTFKTVFIRMFNVGDEARRMLNLLHFTTLALLEAGNKTFLDIRRFLINPDFQNEVLEAINDPTVLEFWYQEFPKTYPKASTAPISTRLAQFALSPVTRNILGQAKNTIDLYDIMNSGKVLLCPLGKIQEEERQLLGSLLVSQLQLATMKRAEMPEAQRRPFTLYIDEFQNFANDAESLEKILSEARKYNLALTLAHQFTSQLPTKLADAIIGNAYTKIIFRVGVDDAAYLQKAVMGYEPKDLQNLAIGQAVMCAGRAQDSFTLKTEKFADPPANHQAEAIIEHSRKTYCRPRADIERELRPQRPTGGPKPSAGAAAADIEPPPGDSLFDDLLGKQ